MYLKVSYLAHFCSLFVQPNRLCHIQQLNQVSLLNVDDTVINLLDFFKFDFLTWKLKYFPTLSLTYFRECTNCFSIFPKLNFSILVQNNDSYFFISRPTQLLDYKSCHFHIRHIWHMHHLLPLSAATLLANSLVSSKLDHWNSFYNGIPQTCWNKIQHIQSTHVITNVM